MLSVRQKLEKILPEERCPTLREIFFQRENLRQEDLQVMRKRQWDALIRLYLGYNQFPSLKMMESVNFLSLTILDLKGCMIESIEALSCMKIPQLESLIIKKNKINSIRTMTHLNCPKLNYLSLYGNCIKNYRNYSSLLSFPILQTLILQYSNNFVLEEDPSCILKLETSTLKNLLYKSLNRIKHEKCIKIVEQKYLEIQL